MLIILGVFLARFSFPPRCRGGPRGGRARARAAYYIGLIRPFYIDSIVGIFCHFVFFYKGLWSFLPHVHAHVHQCMCM